MNRRSSSAFTWFVSLVLILLGILIVSTLIVAAIDLSITKRVGDGLSLTGEAFRGYISGLSLPMASNPCFDGNACTNDVVLGDRTCIHRPYMNSYNCSAEDLCYLPQTTVEESLLYPKYCCNGICVSNRSRCLGICPSAGIQLDNPSTCSYSLFPLNYDQFQNVSLSCIYGSCTLLTIQTHTTTRSLSDAEIFNITQCPSLTFAFTRCIQYECSLSDNASVICMFRFICATYDLGNNVLDQSVGHSYRSESELKLNIATIRNQVRASPQTKYKFPSFGQKLPTHIREDLNTKLDAFMLDFNRHLPSN